MVDDDPVLAAAQAYCFRWIDMDSPTDEETQALVALLRQQRAAALREAADSMRCARISLTRSDLAYWLRRRAEEEERG